MNDVIKAASQYLRETVEAKHGYKVQSSHAHAAVAGYLGFKSKKALLVYYGCPIEDEHILQHLETNVESLSKTISRMKSKSSLKDLPPHQVAEIIETGLTPECECCCEKTVNSSPVYTEDCEDDPDGYVCYDCSSLNHDEYATCRFCGPGIVYRADKINANGECPVHKGDGDTDEEELEDL